ncbi:MAG TPA: hypothetical protein EYQ73_00125 [Candidatus Poseidoniales archaeon]|jgi:hypothetical protein|nr:MAG: hypothetical protein CXT71_05985 [Euryarchaeota archaeon]HIF45197.1 hypothetical protein [Candidatus Poseidoniales archaeon]HIL65356.1 hypothetical protein [Candidatus Poseidoniales archaeon]
MGIEMILHLVDEKCLNSILKMDWTELVDSMSKSTLRDSRPKKDSILERSFDIDCEAEFLDLAEAITERGITKKVLANTSSFDVLLKLIEWCSIGNWNAWEARCYLYIENAIGHKIDSMYSENVWDEVRLGLGDFTASDFSEKVCEDWMHRREKLGETLDQSKDPRIIPTFEAHDRNSRTLHHAVTKKNFLQILGREHLPPQDWGHGQWNLKSILDS